MKLPHAQRSGPSGDVAERLVLLADADDNNALYETAALEMLGYDVVRVRDGGTAVALVMTGLFDLVMMELRMPLLNGADATRAIRRFEASARRIPTPIVALTASVMPHEQVHCTEAGMDDVLPKPFTLPDLRRTVDRWQGTQAVCRCRTLSAKACSPGMT
ncbi:response regulator [Aquincola sp. S2]|uniref:Response regulator n=1 Tax=Pseudaquabacterium terrae TaxID=2732868 RepID=A0ABX2EA72_9BURK|nr:response regulator [Aquabacterium terrae]NRF65403.1 response regulator [Aquabacterium terrae]